MNTREMLESEIQRNIKELAKHTPGSKEHKDAVASLDRLYKIHIDDLEKERTFMAKCDENVLLEKDILVKEAQLKVDRRNTWIKMAVDTAGVVIPVVFYGIWMGRGFKFEETGTFTSTTFRGLISKFKIGK